MLKEIGRSIPRKSWLEFATGMHEIFLPEKNKLLT